MRKQVMFLLLAATLLFGIGIAKAQSELIYGSVKTTVPFAFFAGDSRFPAGSYTVKRLDETDPSILEISSADGRVGGLILVHQDQANKDAKKTELVFNKYGSRFFLSGIAVEGSNLSVALDKSHYEKLVGSGEAPGEGKRVAGAHIKPAAKK